METLNIEKIVIPTNNKLDQDLSYKMIKKLSNSFRELRRLSSLLQTNPDNILSLNLTNMQFKKLLHLYLKNTNGVN